MDEPTAGQDAAWPSFLSLVLVALGTLGLFCCVVVLFMGMRGVLELGGFVASGGPYEIAHPAPDWVWMIPVSFILGALFVMIQAVGATMAGGFKIIGAMWAALFLSLGWNFLEFGFDPPGGGLAWGWIVNGVVFILMGIVPLIGWLPWFSDFRALTRSGWFQRRELEPRSNAWYAYLAIHIGAAGVGAVAGLAFFDAFA